MKPRGLSQEAIRDRGQMAAAAEIARLCATGPRDARGLLEGSRRRRRSSLENNAADIAGRPLTLLAESETSNSPGPRDFV